MTRRGAEPRLCRLEETEGLHVVCVEDRCAFWEPGGAVLEGRCVLEGIDFSREPGLARWLIEIRDGIGQANGHSPPAHR